MDHKIYGRRPDIIAVQKDKNLCQIIDGRVDTKELEKIEHYQDLTRELRKIWNMKNYTTSDRCPRNNTHKVKKMVEGNKVLKLR